MLYHACDTANSYQRFREHTVISGNIKSTPGEAIVEKRAEAEDHAGETGRPDSEAGRSKGETC